jgi:nucleoside-diphosphate-sugar epimerase
LHLVIGAGEFLGGQVSRALGTEVPVIELSADADEETLNEAMRGVEIVINCAQAWSPARRLRFRKNPPASTRRVVEAARRAGVGRLVHVSTSGVYGSGHVDRITEKSQPNPAHPYTRLRLFEEQWLLEQASRGNFEVVILRPGRVFGLDEDWLLPPLMAAMAKGRLWLPNGGRAVQSFVAATDVGRACLAAGDRGRPGRAYIVAGFDATWRDLLESCARAAGFAAEISGLPFRLAYARAQVTETMTGEGATVWPGTYSVDVIGRTHLLDDSTSRRQLTWSPSIGSFEQEMPAMAGWLSGLPGVSDLLASGAAESLEATSPQGT